MFSEGNAAHPVVWDSMLQRVMAFWLFFLNLNLLVWVRQLGADFIGCLAHSKFFLKSAANSHYYLQAGCHKLTRSLGRIVCREKEDPKGSKDTLLRPDFQPNT
jgi:hypothetical protein